MALHVVWLSHGTLASHASVFRIKLAGLNAALAKVPLEV